MLDVPFTPDEKAKIWEVEFNFRLTPSPDSSLENPVKLTLQAPKDYEIPFEILESQNTSPGYFFTRPAEKSDTDYRQVTWTSDANLDRSSIYYRVLMLPKETKDFNYGIPSDQDRLNIHNNLTNYANKDKLQAILDGFNTLDLPEPNRVLYILQELSKLTPEQKTSLLTELNYRKLEDLWRDLVNLSGIPAFPVSGFLLEDDATYNGISTRSAFLIKGQLHYYNPETNKVAVDPNFFIWGDDRDWVTEVENGSLRGLRIAVKQTSLSVSSIAAIKNTSNPLAQFSLYKLPTDYQISMNLLLLLPLGALIVVLLRVFVGVRTTGTFMPVLLALAFFEIGLLKGLAIFLTITAIGIIVRSFLNKVNILLVARIAVVIALVILIIVILSLITNALDLFDFFAVAFLPMIIIAWTIERLSVVIDEDGMKEAVIQLAGSLGSAILVFGFCKIELVQYLVSYFPEMLFIEIGAMLLLGHYTGYRLLELTRFGSFANQHKIET